MAKKKTSTPSGAHLLRKTIPMVHVLEDSEETDEWGIVGQSSGWEIINNGTTNALLVWRGYFDLSGYVREDLTAFYMGGDFQESNIYQVANIAAPNGAVHNWDMYTKQLVDDEDWIFISSGNFFVPPGFRESLRTPDEVLYGRQRELAPDNQVFSNLVIKNQNMWGTGTATAGDRIHITRVYKIGGNFGNGGVLFVPSTICVASVVVDKEKDLVHMERLRRSYNRHRGA